MNKPVEKSYRLKTDDVLFFPNSISLTEPLLENSAMAKTFENWIIFQNDSIIALNKPAGIACQGGSGVKVSIDRLSSEFHSAKIMHRIDKNVSGILILGKNNQALQMTLNNKIYYAIVIGRPESRGIITDKLLNNGEKTVISEEGKVAISEYETLETVTIEENSFSLVKVKIENGRKHQIRVHLASGLGTPIIGDYKYGGSQNKRIYLHAFSCFVDDMVLNAPFPNDFLEMLKKLNFKTQLELEK